MTEQQRILYAIRYLTEMAAGQNPLTHVPVSEDDLVRDPHIANCLRYTADILSAVLENGGTAEQPDFSAPERRMRERKPPRPKFTITEAQRTTLVPADHPIYIRDIAALLNSAAEDNGCRGIPPQKMNEWLLSLGFLETEDLGRKTPAKKASAAGKALGISSELYYDNLNRPAYRNLYTPEAQQFIFDNLDALLAYLRK